MKHRQICRTFFLLLLFFLMPCAAKVQAEEWTESRLLDYIVEQWYYTGSSGFHGDIDFSYDPQGDTAIVSLYSLHADCLRLKWIPGGTLKLVVYDDCPIQRLEISATHVEIYSGYREPDESRGYYPHQARLVWLEDLKIKPVWESYDQIERRTSLTISDVEMKLSSHDYEMFDVEMDDVLIENGASVSAARGSDMRWSKEKQDIWDTYMNPFNYSGEFVAVRIACDKLEIKSGAKLRAEARYCLKNMSAEYPEVPMDKVNEQSALALDRGGLILTSNNRVMEGDVSNVDAFKDGVQVTKPTLTYKTMTKNATDNITGYGSKPFVEISDITRPEGASPDQGQDEPADPSEKTYTLSFDANGGTVKDKTKDVAKGSRCGTLPTPTRSGYTFAGWHSAKSGGTKVTADTYFTWSSDITLYAHWTKDVAAVTENPRITKTSLTLTVGQSGALQVTGTPKTPSWSTSNSKVATVKNGKVTAKKAGTATITAKVSGKKLTCKVTVKAAKTLKISMASAALTKGQKITLRVTNASGKVKWKSSNTKVATVSGSGAVTAKGVGSATITATVGKDKATCKVTVKAKTPKLNKTSATLNKGKSLSLKVTDATGKVKWKSSNTKVATVNGSGRVTAKKAGTATITATVGGKKLTCKVTVGGNTYKKQDVFLEVGKDMPAGKYRLVPQKEASSYMIMEMKDGFDAEEKSLKNEKTVTLKKGWFIMLSGCYAVLLS